MQKSFLKLFILFTLLTLSSCIEDNNQSVSCITLNDGFNDNYFIETEVFTSKKLNFTLLNECDINIRVTDFDIQGEHANDFKFENLSKNTNITKKGITFNIHFKPQNLGKRKAVITISHDLGKFVIHLSGEGI